eukprot:6580923-Pyramimonas_sp.AAC.1
MSGPRRLGTRYICSPGRGPACAEGSLWPPPPPVPSRPSARRNAPARNGTPWPAPPAGAHHTRRAGDACATNG